jgi:hypothetical protein
MVVGLISCGGDARNDPYIAQKFSEIDGQLAKMKDVPARVQDFNEDIMAIREDLAKLKGAGGGPGIPPQRLTDIENRLAALEAAIKTLGKGGGAASKLTARAPTPTPAPTPAPAPPKAEPAAPTATPAPVAPTPRATPLALQTKPGAPPTSPTAPAGKAPSGKGKAAGRKKGAEEPAAPSGAYYVAVEGDTLASIAQKFGISVADICGANTFLRPDSAVYAGLKVWVPKK